MLGAGIAIACTLQCVDIPSRVISDICDLFQM
jgi:hypothetical protein